MNSGQPEELNFTQYCGKYGFTDDYSRLDHGDLSPSGRRTKRGEKARLQRMRSRFDSNTEGHNAYISAILSGDVIDPSGETTKEKLDIANAGQKAKAAAERISQITSQIQFLSDVGRGKRGIKPKYQKLINQLTAERANLGVIT